jgi:hypothetical protein
MGACLASPFCMVNRNRKKKNDPPTGEGKHQSPFAGAPRKLAKRSDVVQAQRGHPELNLGSSDEEAAAMDGDVRNPKKRTAGR